MRVGAIFQFINMKSKEFLPLIQVVGIFTGLLIVFFTYRHLNVTIENIELYRKELLQEQIPILDFRMMNEQTELLFANPKISIPVTRSIKLAQLNPRIRLNLVKVDFPTRKREIVPGKDFNLMLPVFMADHLKIYPPEFEWNTKPFLKQISHYSRNKNFEPKSQSYFFNRKIPISLTQQYNSFGEIRKLIGIYGVDYDVFVSNLNNKTSYSIEIKNIYLIRILGVDEKHIDVLNSIFDSIADIELIGAQNG